MVFKKRLIHFFLVFVSCAFFTISDASNPQVFLKRTQEISFGNFLRTPGFFLDVKTIAPASSVLNSIECGLNCVFTNSCVSYNYKYGGSGGTNCELLAVDRFFNSTLFREDSKYDYFYIKRMCDDNPCRNNGKCISYIQDNNYTCECTAPFKGQICSEPICSQEVPHGMASGAIKDNQLSMSSYYNNDATYGERNGRLNKTTWPYGAQTKSGELTPWFQINLLTPKVITAVGIQGYGAPDGASWTKSYQISSTLDGTTWEWYQEIPGVNKTLPGNTNAQTEVRSKLKAPIKARIVKIWATSCTAICTFRLELFGCNL